MALPKSRKKPRAPRRAWRKPFQPGEVLQRVRPTETDAWLPNPHRGTTTFQRFNGAALYPGMQWNDREGPERFPPFDGKLENPRYPNTTLSYCRWLWPVIEPEKGHYRWEIIDGALEAARVRGQTLQARLQPYIGEQTPEWYWEAGGKAIPDPRNPQRRVMDHNHPAYLKHWGALIRAFAKRYDGHPVLESFDVAYGGSCGETGGNCTRGTAIQLVEIYRKHFKKTQLLSMLGTHGCKHLAQFPEIGWRADCFGDVHTEGLGQVPENKNWNHMYDAYPKEVAECGVSEAWKQAPVTLETCWTVPYWVKQGWDLDWILAQGLKYHASVFMPKSCYIPESCREKVDAFDRRLGYRFVLRQATLPLEARPGARMEVRLWIENVGVAPLYRPYRLALRFKQGREEHVVPLQADPRAWLPGDVYLHRKLTFPRSLRRGVTDVDVGLVDPETETPKVWFAIKELKQDGWHPLSKMDVL